MKEYSAIAAVLLALLGIFKGKEAWEFLKHLVDARRCKKDVEEKDKIILAQDKKIKQQERSITRLKKLIK